MEREPIHAVGDFQIVYTGVMLDTADLEVYEEILHRAGRDLGSNVFFKTREFLRSIGRATGKRNREWLLKSLSRLSGCEVEISNGRKAYGGSLVDDQGRDDEAGTHYVRLKPSIASLFAQGYAVRDPVQIRQLGNAQLAKWLFGFTAGQERPLTFRIDDLAKHARSGYSRRRDFQAHLDKAAEQIRSIGRDLRLEWDNKNNKVTIFRDKDRDFRTSKRSEDDKRV